MPHTRTVRADGVLAVCSQIPHQQDFDRMVMSLTTEEAVKQFTALLRRGLNCDDGAPAWLHELADKLAGIPAPYNARDGMQFAEA